MRFSHFAPATTLTIFIGLSVACGGSGNGERKVVIEDRVYNTGDTTGPGGGPSGGPNIPGSTTGGAAGPGPGTGSTIPVGSPIPTENFEVAIPLVSVTSDAGAAPTKGGYNILSITVQNVGKKPGKTRIIPFLTSKRFTDYENVRLPSADVTFNPGEKKIVPIKLESFISDPVTKKEYALNRGDYTVRFELEFETTPKKEIRDVPGSAFSIAKSNVMLNAVFHSSDFLSMRGYTGTITKFIDETFSEKVEVFDSSNKVTTYAKGLNEVLGIQQKYRTFEGYKNSITEIGPQLDAHNKEANAKLGLAVIDWETCNQLTSVKNQGFDMFYFFNSGMAGSVAGFCVNSLFVSGKAYEEVSVVRAKQQLLTAFTNVMIENDTVCSDASNVRKCQFAVGKDELFSNGRWSFFSGTIAAMKKLNSEK